MSDRPLLILGAGTFATELLEAAECGGRTVVGFVVSEPSFRTVRVHEGLPVCLPGELEWKPGAVDCIAGIVSTKRRAIVDMMADLGYTFASLVHPRAMVSRRASIAPGAFVSTGAIVSANTRIGAHVIVNRGANIAHDVVLGDLATVGPGAVLAGAVDVGARAWIGVGAVVRDHTAVGEGAVVAAGALVVREVPAHTLVAGSPAKVVKEGVDGY